MFLLSDVVVVPTNTTTVVLNMAFVLSLLVSTVIPIIVGIVTKLNASSGTKALVMVILNALNGFLMEAIAGGDVYNWTLGLVNFLIGMVTSVATYYGVLKPIGASSSVQNSTANFGIGGSKAA